MRVAEARLRHGFSSLGSDLECIYWTPVADPSRGLRDWPRPSSLARVVGLDQAPTVLEHARAHATEKSVKNATFVTGDIYCLDLPDHAFDVVYANQLLQHLSETGAGANSNAPSAQTRWPTRCSRRRLCHDVAVANVSRVSRLASALPPGCLSQWRRTRRRPNTGRLGPSRGLFRN